MPTTLFLILKTTHGLTDSAFVNCSGPSHAKGVSRDAATPPRAELSRWFPIQLDATDHPSSTYVRRTLSPTLNETASELFANYQLLPKCQLPPCRAATVGKPTVNGKGMGPMAGHESRELLIESRSAKSRSFRVEFRSSRLAEMAAVSIRRF